MRDCGEPFLVQSKPASRTGLVMIPHNPGDILNPHAPIVAPHPCCILNLPLLSE